MRWTRSVSLLFCVLLAACASTSPPQREWEDATAHGDSCAEEDRCNAFVCDEGGCSVFRCEDMAAGRVVLARGAAVAAPAAPRPPRRRLGGDVPLPGEKDAILTFRWNNHPAPRLRSQQASVIRDPVKHHIFPQQAELARWFRRKGLDIHQHTMVIERADHVRIHRGANGGPWNEAWREFHLQNQNATKEDIWRHAMELLFRFELTGPVVPYSRRLPPPPIPKEGL